LGAPGAVFVFCTWKAYCINTKDIVGVEPNAIIVEVNIFIRKLIGVLLNCFLLLLRALSLAASKSMKS
jgi:hypothetical protein